MSLFITPFGRATNSNNAVLNGARWYFYLTGTLTPADTYTTSARDVANANPVVADSGGLFPSIYLDPTITYRAVLKDPSGNTIQDIDPYFSTNDADDIRFDPGSTGADVRTLADKSRETVSLADYATAQAAINAAGGNPVLVNQTVTEDVANSLGSHLYGTGSIRLTAAVGGSYQHPQQTYALDAQRSALKANLYRIYARIMAGGTLTGFLYGDSTVATAANGGGYAGTDGEPQSLMARMLKRKGVRNPISITNRAVGGTDFGDLDAIPDIDTVGGTTDFFLIKYGINDARTESGDITADLLTFAATVDSKLSAIRASSGFGTVDNLTIILVGPTNTWDPQHGRTNIWYERTRDVLRAAAIKHQCFFYDPYPLMPGNIGWLAGENGGMTDDFGNGQPIHPKEIIQSLWVADLVDAMMSEGSLTLWSGVEPVNLTLGLNSWVSAAADGFTAPFATMDQNGRVTLGGAVKSGTPTSGQAIAQLPSSVWWPYALDVWTCATSGGSCQLRVNPANGNIEQHDGTANTAWVSLAGISFLSR
jgi:hypothetical protein